VTGVEPAILKSASPGTHRPDTQTKTLSRSRGQSNVPASEAPERRAGLAPAYREWRSRVLLLDDRRRMVEFIDRRKPEGSHPRPEGPHSLALRLAAIGDSVSILLSKLVLEVRVELTRPRGSDRLSTCCVCQFRHSSVEVTESGARGENCTHTPTEGRQVLSLLRLLFRHSSKNVFSGRRRARSPDPWVRTVFETGLVL
jgi:hypothetical protein